MMSVSSSQSLLNLFRGGKSADELLKSKEIIKKMIIGLSYLDDKNPNSIPRKLFGDLVSHASIFFMMGQKNKKTGILVQYGKYEYIKKNKNILNVEANSIGYPYGEKGGLIFGEVEYNVFINQFCSICDITPTVTHLQITLNKFIEEVKKKGQWDLNSYNFNYNNCQNFAAAGISVINPKYNPSFIHVRDNTYFKGDDEEQGLPSCIIDQLNKNRIEID